VIELAGATCGEVMVIDHDLCNSQTTDLESWTLTFCHQSILLVPCPFAEKKKENTAIPTEQGIFDIE
jgi:hypothetical protein